MTDHYRLNALTELVEHSGAKLIAVGDAKQLPSIGPGGMFDRLSGHARTAELQDVYRTRDPAEQRAWQALRAGEPERAMAHYVLRNQLHFQDTRDEAGEAAVQRWHTLTQQHGVREVALIADASNQEIDRLNARAQHLRAQHGELGEHQVQHPDVHYPIREGDLIAFTSQHRLPGQPRVENGTRGEITAIHPRGVRIALDGSDRHVNLPAEDLGSIRLGYAQHVYRQQGATVQRSVVLTGGWQTSKESAYVQATPHATAPTGSSHVTSSASKDKTPTASGASPNTSATAAHRSRRWRTQCAPSLTGAPAATRYELTASSRRPAGSRERSGATPPSAAPAAAAEIRQARRGCVPDPLRKSLPLALNRSAIRPLRQARQQRRLGTAPERTRVRTGRGGRCRIRTPSRRRARQLHHQPVFEHYPREAQMTPHAHARQMPQPCRITHPRDPHVQQRRRSHAIEQRLVQRHHLTAASPGLSRSLVEPRHLPPLLFTRRKAGRHAPCELAQSCPIYVY